MNDDTEKSARLLTVGWREWIALPDLALPRLKAKVDTGARTSALHTFELDPYRDGGELRVRFGMHPKQRNATEVVYADAAVTDRRTVSDSGGHREERFVITTDVELGGRRWPIELTLTDRDTMLFRMLLGRSAMNGRLCVDPSLSYCCGRPPKRRRHSGKA
ncbi:MAG: RimK/LysX family protein [Pseudomonadota bacterium]